VAEAERLLVCDPVTSGGLLVAIPRERADALEGAVIGWLCDGEPGRVSVA
jgi:selenophosphate synthase